MNRRMKRHGIVWLLIVASIAGAGGEEPRTNADAEILRLVKELDDDSMEVRARAQERLEAIGEPARPALEKAALDPAPGRAEAAAGILKSWAERSQLDRWNRVFPPELRAELEKTEPGVADRFLAFAIRGWEQLSEADALAAINPLLFEPQPRGMLPFWRELGKHPSRNVRMAVLERLAYFKDEEAIPDIGALSKDPEADTRTAAARMLVKIGSEQALRSVFPILDDEAASVRRHVARELFSRNGMSLAGQAGRLHGHPDPVLKGYGLILLARQEGKAREKEVQSVLEEGAGELKRAAVFIAAEQGWNSCVPGLIRILKNPSETPELRRAVLRALELLEAKEASAAAAECLSDNKLRAQAAAALSRIGDAGATAPLLKCLRDCRDKAKGEAFWAMILRGKKGASLSGLEVLNSPDLRDSQPGIAGRMDTRAMLMAMENMASARSEFLLDMWGAEIVDLRRICVEALERIAGGKREGNTWKEKTDRWLETK